MKKVKILILANNCASIYKFRKELVLRLLENDNSVLVAAPAGNYFEELVEMGCTCYKTSIERRGTNPLKDIKLFKQYARIIAKEKPDIVLSYTIKPNVYGGLACRLYRIPYIANVTGLGTSIENPGLLRKVALSLYKIGLKNACCVFFQNRSNCDFFKHHVLNCEKHIRIIPGSGVNLNEHKYETYPSESGGLRFLFIGRVMKDKGVDELFAAAESVKAIYPNVKFQFIGVYDEEYEERINLLTNNGVIDFLGYKSDVHSYIKVSHCTILPSYHEGTANVLLESAACGRSVITTKVPGCQETIDDGITGLGCEVRSVDDLVAKIEQFIGMSEAEHEAMGYAGRLKMESEYDRQIVIDAYLDEIEQAIKKN